MGRNSFENTRGTVLKVTRREFLKISATTASLAALAHFTFGDSLSTLISKFELQEVATEDVWLPTTCWIGKQDCGVLARRVNGRIVKLEGHPAHPRNRGKLCPKGVAQIMQLYDPYRVKAPLKRRLDLSPKGKPGVWEEITWDQALNEVAAQLKALPDKKLFVWLKGRSKSSAFYDNAFNKAFGTVNKITHGAVCSDAVYRANELTFSVTGSLTADFKYCNYLIAWGFNFTEAGGPHLCFITWPQQILDARERGMKIVLIDPRIRGGAHFVDEWVPIKPGTDMALALAMAKVLIEKGYIDGDYLRRYTNAPFLVNVDDGLFLRGASGKEQVWEGEPRDHDTAIEPALTGSYEIGGKTYRPAFQMFIDHVNKYTIDEYAAFCGVPADTIVRIAQDFGRNAMIGSTISIDGIELPYRPVAIATYHASQQELGTQAWRAIAILSMLVGAVDTVGSTRFFERKVDYARYQGKWESMAKDPTKVKDTPEKLSLEDSRFYPIASDGYTQAPLTLIDDAEDGPHKYGLPYKPEDMVMIIHMTNPVLAAPNQQKVIEGYKKLKFVVVIDPWISETADYLADIILPAATMEKYEGPLNVGTQYESADTLRIPIIDPLFQSKSEARIYMELCDKLGILVGTDGYIHYLNEELKLRGTPWELDENTRPADYDVFIEDVFDRWAKIKGKDLAWFKTNGVKVSKIPTSELYMRAWSPPYNGVKAHLCSEILLRLRRIMQSKGVEAIYYQDYTPFPTWRTPTMESSPGDYDLYLISYKKIEHKQSRTAFNALLNEIEPQNYLLINSQTAKNKGIGGGDVVWVESHNARTGETYKIQVKAKLIEGIRPDTVAISHHHGHWVHPLAKGKGVAASKLFPSGEGYIDMTGNQSFIVKVKVYK